MFVFACCSMLCLAFPPYVIPLLQTLVAFPSAPLPALAARSFSFVLVYLHSLILPSLSRYSSHRHSAFHALAASNVAAEVSASRALNDSVSTIKQTPA